MGVEDTNIKQISCGPKHSSQSGGKLLHVTADVVYPTKSEALLISVEVRCIEETLGCVVTRRKRRTSSRYSSAS